MVDNYSSRAGGDGSAAFLPHALRRGTSPVPRAPVPNNKCVSLVILVWSALARCWRCEHAIIEPEPLSRYAATPVVSQRSRGAVRRRSVWQRIDTYREQDFSGGGGGGGCKGKRVLIRRQLRPYTRARIIIIIYVCVCVYAMTAWRRRQSFDRWTTLSAITYPRRLMYAYRRQSVYNMRENRRRTIFVRDEARTCEWHARKNGESDAWRIKV